MYLYGIYPTGNSDVIPVALSSTLVISHLYVSDEPIQKIATRMEFRIPYQQAVDILKEVNVSIAETIENNQSDFVYFAIAINPKYDQSKQVTERTLNLNGRSIPIKNVSFGAIMESQQDFIYDSEVVLLPIRPKLIVDGQETTPCSLCEYSNLKHGKKYCVYYTRGFQCLFTRNNTLQITCEGFAEACVPIAPELPDNLQDDPLQTDYGIDVDEETWEVD